MTVACSNAALFPLENITVTNPEGGDGSERTVQAIPAADQFGTANITLTVHDSGGRTDSVTFSVTVDSVDDTNLPAVTTNTKSLRMSRHSSTYSPTTTRIIRRTRSSSRSRRSPTAPSHGTAEIAVDGKSVYYKTVKDSNDADSFTYTVHDSFSETDYTFTVSITVIPVNDAPVVTMTGGTEFTTYEGIAVNDIPFTVTDVDNDVDTLTLSAASGNPILVLNGLHIDDGTGEARTIDVQPYRKWNGTTTITISAYDGDKTGTASLTFIVNSVNEAPVANDDTFTVQEDALTFLDVLDNDTDGDLETNPDTEYIIVQIRNRRRPECHHYGRIGRQRGQHTAQCKL